MCVYDEVTKVSEVPRPRVHGFLDCNITHVSSRAPLPHTLALIDVDRFNFVWVQLCQDRQRPARPLHLKRIRRVAGAPNPHCAPRGSALRSQGLRPQVSRQEMRQAEGSKPFLPALVRLFVLLVVRHTHVLQPHRVAKVDGGQGLRLRRCLRRVLGLVGLVLHAGQLVTARLRITSLGSLQSPLALLHGFFPPTPFKYLSFSPDNPHKRALEEILKPGALSRKRPTTPSYENLALYELEGKSQNQSFRYGSGGLTNLTWQTDYPF